MIEPAGDDYAGGEPAIDAALQDGVLRIAPIAESSAAAVIPRSFEETSLGALAVLKLFDHQPSFSAEDSDLLSLLAVHASSALYSAEIHAGVKNKRS